MFGFGYREIEKWAKPIQFQPKFNQTFTFFNIGVSSEGNLAL